MNECCNKDTCNGYDIANRALDIIIMYQKQFRELDKYFTSKNDIPVERATILAKDYWKIRNCFNE